MRIQGTQQEAYWLEIESKDTENFTSAILVGIRGNVQEVLRWVIAAVPPERGVLKNALSDSIAGHVRYLHLVHHNYMKNSTYGITPHTMQRELIKAGVIDRE